MAKPNCVWPFGKFYTVVIEGHKYRLRHRIKRTIRKNCCFPKKVLNHENAFNIEVFYINIASSNLVKIWGILLKHYQIFIE